MTNTNDSHKVSTLDDIMGEFDINTEAHMDEMDRMEKKMEIMEQDMDAIVDYQIRMAGKMSDYKANKNYMHKESILP